MNTTPESRSIAIWLFSGCFLIFCMVVIGGITRLTGSGLSITEWNVVMGAVPPLNDQDWQVAFDKYKMIPQYTEVNSYFTLEDFKSIFWWEFIHRLVGRLIGFVFLVPFVWFLYKRMLDYRMLKKALFLFALGGLQGFLGWFMVKSGLSERTSVSHIRLAIHLLTAFTTFGFTLWFALPLVIKHDGRSDSQTALTKLTRITLAVITIQLVYGAFVAGLHAGKMFNTFPLMNGSVFPDAAWVNSWGIDNLFYNPATIQFIHRLLAFLIVFMIAGMFVLSGRTAVDSRQRNAVRLLLVAVGVQFTLGMITILYHAPVSWSSVHQIGAFFLFTAVLYAMYLFRPASVAS
jgi:cytochrome c oxidase assembly protein subunit 15